MKPELISHADAVRKALKYQESRRERAAVGQFLTPPPIARYMAGLFQRMPEHVRLLDPGTGAGALSAAFIEAVLHRGRKPHAIEVVAYENNELIMPELHETMEQCKQACEASGIAFHAEIQQRDFIEAALEQTEGSLFVPREERFTHAILNPPYKKLNCQTATHRLLESAGMSVSNLYAAFVWLSARLLVDGGELAAITPRSFCNGPYFRAFRVQFLDMMDLARIHVFESRKKAFGDDSVLQENVIYYAQRGKRQAGRVGISSSEGLEFENALIRTVPYDLVVFPGDRDKFIHLALNESDEEVAKGAETINKTLFDIGLEVSTGRVVDFRARRHLLPAAGNGTVPLIYPCHFKDGFVNWPNGQTKKPNGIAETEETKDLLIPTDFYVLTKRFTSKEEKRRVVAAVFDPNEVKAGYVGFENHLNYFHEKGKGMPGNLAKGLALYLNSTLFDRYFRLFSGHTQVNATDLRKMRYPARDRLARLGKHVKAQMPAQDVIDAIVKKEIGSNA